MENINLEELISEFCGTSMLGFAGVYAYAAQKKDSSESTDDYSLVVIGLATAAVITSFYVWSQSQLNPLLAVARECVLDTFNWVQLLCTLFAQFLGAILGVFLAMKICKLDKLEPDHGAIDYIKDNYIKSVFIDAVTSFLLTFTYMQLICNQDVNSIQVGIMMAIIYVLSRKITQSTTRSDINIATALGSAIFKKDGTTFFKMCVGPVLGAVIAVALQKLYCCGYLKFPNLISSEKCKEECKEEFLEQIPPLYTTMQHEISV